MNEYKFNNALTALFGYLEAIQEGITITKDYATRLYEHYIPAVINAKNELQPTAEVEPSCDVVEKIEDALEGIGYFNKDKELYKQKASFKEDDKLNVLVPKSFVNNTIIFYEHCENIFKALQQKPKADVELVEALKAALLEADSLIYSEFWCGTDYASCCNKYIELRNKALSIPPFLTQGK